MTDDFRLPPDHPYVLELRREREERAAQLEALHARLTTHASPQTQLVTGVALALFVRDNPASDYRTGNDDAIYPNPTADEVLGVLGYVSEVRSALDNDERALIEGARRRGATWQQIAKALGLKSRQGARQRYARLGGKPAELDEQIEANRSALAQAIETARGGNNVSGS